MLARSKRRDPFVLSSYPSCCSVPPTRLSRVANSSWERSVFHRPIGLRWSSLNAVFRPLIVQIVLNERLQISENLGWLANQIFIMDLDIVLAQPATSLPPLAHNPFPIDPRRHGSPLSIPGQPADLGKFLPRQGYIPAITDHMNDECVGDVFFNPAYVQQVLRGGFRPSLHPLLATHLLHDDAEKIAAVLALRHYSWLNFRGLKARFCIKPSVVPGIEHPALVPRLAERAKARFEQGKDERLRAVNSKIPRRQEHMVQQGRARPAAANDKNRRLAPSGSHRSGLEIVHCRFWVEATSAVEENSTAEQSVRKAKSTTVIGVLKWRCKAGAVLQALLLECE